MSGRVARGGWVAALLALGAWGDAEAQAASVHAGSRMYDFGREPAVAVRGDFSLGEPFAVELAASFAGMPDSATAASVVVEGQLQFSVPLSSRLTPYAGIGLAAASVRDSVDATGVRAMLSVGAGVRYALTDQLSLVGDARMRPPLQGDAEGAHADVTVGVRYLFRRPDRPRFFGAP